LYSGAPPDNHHVVVGKVDVDGRVGHVHGLVLARWPSADILTGHHDRAGVEGLGRGVKEQQRGV